VATQGSRPATSSRGDPVWVFVAVFALALIGAKVGNLFDLHLPWLYAVAAGANVGIVSVHVSRQRRRTRPTGQATRAGAEDPQAPAGSADRGQ
jgi:hypothetical protein